MTEPRPLSRNGNATDLTIAGPVLVDRPQQEITLFLRDRLDRCCSASLVAGFITVEGIEAISEPICSRPTKVVQLVVGAGTCIDGSQLKGWHGTFLPARTAGLVQHFALLGGGKHLQRPNLRPHRKRDCGLFGRNSRGRGAVKQHCLASSLTPGRRPSRPLAPTRPMRG